MKNPPRLVTALITPFTRSGHIDLDAHRHNLEALTQQGIKGFLIGGSTGEGPYLDTEERHLLVGAARRTLGKGPFLLAGVAGESSRSALAQTEEAAEGGADAVLVVTPTTMVRGNHSAVAAYFEDLADAARVPVFLYSVPAVTGYTLPVETAITLSRHPNITGMKDSGGDPVAMTRLAELTVDGFVLMTGSSKAVRLCIAAGAHGAITASSNYLPKLAGRVVTAARRNLRTAGELQAKLTSISTAVEAHRVPGVKAGAGMTGLRPGHLRKPLRPVPPKDKRAIAKVLNEAGIL